MPFRKHQRIRRPLRPTGLKLLAERNLLRTQTLFSMYRGPARGGVAAPQELLVNAFVTGPAVAGRQVGTDDKSMMVDFLLTGTRLMAVKAIHALLCMGGHLVLVDNRILESRMTLGALSGGPDEVGGGLRRLYARTLPIDKKRRHNQRKCNDDCEENRAK